MKLNYLFIYFYNNAGVCQFVYLLVNFKINFKIDFIKTI